MDEQISNTIFIFNTHHLNVRIMQEKLQKTFEDFLESGS